MSENYPESPKRSCLDTMMEDVAKCRKCTTEEGGITQDKRLRNLIAEHRTPPWYGEIPSHFTDWAYRYRLDAKIAMVMQDWGSADHPEFGALVLRKDYEDLFKDGSLSREAAFRKIVLNRPQHHRSKTHNNLTSYLMKSAQKEGLPLPEDCLDHIYFTNAVLCFRRQGSPTGTTNIDLSKSLDHCCSTQRFLHRQLRIVNPSIVVALGRDALKGLIDDSKALRSLITGLDSKARGWPHGYMLIDHYGLRLKLVYVPHPAARLKSEDQIEDYRRIWTALKHVRGRAASGLVRDCFLRDHPAAGEPT